MKISNLFLKALDPLIMNGFKNRKEFDDYWFLSKVGCALTGFGVFCLLLNTLLFSNQILSLYNTIYFSLIYFCIFSFIALMPILGHLLIVKLIPKNLSYWYVRYMWQNSKLHLLKILSDLPPNIIEPIEIEKLHSANDDESTKILIKVWHKSFFDELRKQKNAR